MKSAQMTCVTVGLLFLLGYTCAGIVSGTKKSNDTSELLNSTVPINLSELLRQFEPLGAPSDNVNSISTLTSTSNNKGDPPSVTGSTVTTTSSNAAPAPASRFPYGPFGPRNGNPGPGAPPPLGGSFGGPFVGFPGFPGFGAGGNIGLDVGIGGGLIGKAVVVVGGGILILLGLAAAQVSMGKGGFLNNLGKSFAGSNAGSVSVSGPGGSASASASAAASASLSKNVDESINKKF